MAASKKGKSAVKSRVAKKTSARRQPARGSATTASKRKSGPAKTKVTPPRASESRAASLTTVMAREPERKPAKKAEQRPPRPPAVLPIPQSTFIF